MTQNGLSEHLTNDCVKVKVHCKFCETSYERTEFNDESIHKCVKNMLKLTKELNQKFLVQDAENKKFKDELQKNQDKLKEKQAECREVENKYYVESDKLRKIKREITEARIDGF